jgi:CRP-like cAMP-binding protein
MDQPKRKTPRVHPTAGGSADGVASSPGPQARLRQAPRGASAQVPHAWISPTAARRDLGLLRPDERGQFAQSGTTRTVPAGTVVARAGERVREIQLVIEGELELKARMDGQRVTMVVVRAGGVIGDIPLLIDAPMPYDAVASRETALLSVSRAVWSQLLASSPSLALRWMTSIARRLDDDRRRLVVITCKPLIAQVAYLLITMCETDGTGQPVARLSHGTIAHLLGARRQSVTRVVAELRAQGLIETRYGVTLLRDPPGLRALMGDDPLPSASQE